MNPQSGINLFAGFSSANASEDKSLFYNPNSPYTESQYYELKNLIEKCAKKSQNTKLKSISQISSICESSTDFTLFIDLMPIWVFLFGKLVKYDSEKNVRESAFRLQGLFFSKFKTKFANYVQELFTPLWLGRNDPVKEVSESAKKAFLSAFPENKHKVVLEKCFPRFVSEVTPILQKELNEAEEILERLMSCALLGVKDAILANEGCKSQISVFLERLKIWSFIDVAQKPLVRCAALTCFDAFLTENVLTEANLSEGCPIIFSLVSDKNRLIQQILWGQVLQNLIEKCENISKFTNPNKLISEMAACAARGASGAGSTFYLSLVKVISLIDKSKVQDRQPVERILGGILRGINSEDGSFHGKYALNAYYEVLLYFYIKDSVALTWLDPYFTHPVTLYLNCNTPVNASSYLTVVPSLLSQCLGFLEKKGKLPDISENIFKLISSVLQEKVEIAVNFLQEFAKELGPQGPHCNTIVSNLLYTIHGQLCQDIENLFVLKNLKQLEVNLPLYKSFSEVTIKFTSFEPKVLDWWVRSCRDEFPSNVLDLVAQCNFIHPELWKQALEHSIGSADQLLLLIPKQYEMSLLAISKTSEFLNIVTELLEKVKNSENLSEISKISVCLQRLFSKEMIKTEEMIEKINGFIEDIFEHEKNDWSNLEFSKVFEFFFILHKKINEKSSVFLGKFLVLHGWKNKVKDLWDIFQCIPLKVLNKIIESAQDLLLSSLLSSESWENLITVGQKLLLSTPDKASFINILFTPSLFSKFYMFSPTWKLFASWIIDTKYSLNSFLSSNIWFLSLLLGYEVVPSLSSSPLLYSTLKSFVSSQCSPLLQSQTPSLPFIKSLIKELILLTLKHSAFRVVLLKSLKLCVYSEDTKWQQSDLLDLFKFCIDTLQADSDYSIILCDVIYIFKSLLSHDNYSGFLTAWQEKAYQSADGKCVRVYAACIPDNRVDFLPGDQECLKKIIENGLRPSDLALALSIVRRGGFEALPDLEKLEILVTGVLVEGNELYEVLPYVQRLLSSPEFIFNKEELLDLVINLPLHNKNLTQPELIEISETLSRMYTITTAGIDEESLYKILLTSNNIPLIKSVYSLLNYTYTVLPVSRQGIPPSALSLITQVPSVKSDIMEPETFSYILCWILMIQKYTTERFHKEKAKEPSSDFMNQLKDMLEASAEHVTVFLTTLMAYLHDESDLNSSYEVTWTDILNEDSCAQLSCLAMLRFLSTFPSLGRSWWLGTDRFLSNSIQKVVKKIISSVILQQEIKNIENRQVEWKEKGVSIVCSKAARNITAVFNKSEFTVQVSLQVPNDYPLSPPEPTVTKKVKISEEKVRKWLLSMVQLLQQENSSILELILVWTGHVERELEGIEDCYICYYLVHPTDKSLPNLPCQVCGNKFHKLCIQKWFNSSHNANCPLCRNPFRN